MTSKLTASVLALALAGAVFAPQQAAAGNDEWATAGKILAGVVGVSVLNNHLKDRNVDYQTRTRYYRPKSRCRPQVTHRETVYVTRPVVEVEPEPVYTPAPVQGPVVVHLEEGRRLFQPRVRGATAYLQVWSEVCAEWVSIKEYPSIY